jgi:hypothetical protein
VEQAFRIRVAKAGAFPLKVWAGTSALVRKRYQELKQRYGPRYTHAMLGAAFVALFVPLPGCTLFAVTGVVLIAEAHRQASRRGGVPEAIAGLVISVKANLPGWATGRWPASCR